MQVIEIEHGGFLWSLPYNDVLSKPFMDSATGSSDEHEPHLTRFIREFLKEGDVAMDIGACFGFHTLEMARQVGDSGHVYAFEPQVDMHTLLTRNLKENKLDNATVHNVALGDTNMEVCMYNAYPDSETNYGDSFISWKYREDDAEHDKSEKQQISKGDHVLELNKNLATCSRLDDFLGGEDGNGIPGRVKFIKIDVQGFERMVLEGGEKFLRKHRPFMVIEFEDQCMNFHGYGTKELLAFLKSMDYDVILLDHPYPCDHLCIPHEHAGEIYKQFGDRIVPLEHDNPVNHNYQHGVRERLCLLDDE